MPDTKVINPKYFICTATPQKKIDNFLRSLSEKKPLAADKKELLTLIYTDNELGLKKFFSNASEMGLLWHYFNMKFSNIEITPINIALKINRYKAFKVILELPEINQGSLKKYLLSTLIYCAKKAYSVKILNFLLSKVDSIAGNMPTEKTVQQRLCAIAKDANLLRHAMDGNNTTAIIHLLNVLKVNPRVHIKDEWHDVLTYAIRKGYYNVVCTLVNECETEITNAHLDLSELLSSEDAIGGNYIKIDDFLCEIDFTKHNGYLS